MHIHEEVSRKKKKGRRVNYMGVNQKLEIRGLPKKNHFDGRAEIDNSNKQNVESNGA